MVSIFKTNDLVNVLLLLPYIIAIRIYGVFFQVTAMEPTRESFISFEILKLVQGSVLYNFVIGVLLVYLHCLLINLWCNRNGVLATPSALPGMFYALVVSLSPSFQQLSSTLIGMTFILLALLDIGKIYKNQIAAGNIFNIGLFIALAFFSEPPLLYMLFLGIVSLLVLRSYNTKEVLQLLFGFISLLWIYLSSYFFFSGRLNSDLLNFGWINDLNFLLPGSTSDKITLATYSLLMIIGLFSYYSYLKKKQIDARKKIDLLYWVLLVGLVSVLFYNQVHESYIMVIAFPLSIFLAMKLNIWKNWAAAELIHLGFLSLVIINLYGQSLGIIF